MCAEILHTVYEYPTPRQTLETRINEVEDVIDYCDKMLAIGEALIQKQRAKIVYYQEHAVASLDQIHRDYEELQHSKSVLQHYKDKKTEATVEKHKLEDKLVQLRKVEPHDSLFN